MTYTSNNQQTIFDVALMVYGSIEGLLYLIEDNPEIIKGDGTIAQFGATYQIREAIINPVVLEQMQSVIPATGQEEPSSGPWTAPDGSIWVTPDGRQWFANT